ncbi:restriction endonuclease subunit S [Pseudactinotalea sp. Z1748]|uniref:restriction endonuclease subunit S n=1 Tax=Pseudactinotalea sp. Z1748 TaxID=3413027 RepID=UPI003C7D205C
MKHSAHPASGQRAITLGEIAKLYQSRTISGHELTPHGYPVYGANGHIGYYSNFNHYQSQIAVTCRGNTCGRVNFVPPRSWITGNAMVVNVDGRSDVDKRFLFHYLNGQDLTGLITGSGQPQIVRGPLARLEILLPALSEQQRIAAVADEADDLIATLELVIAKKQAIKQGMMQQLLTGRTRLPGFMDRWSPVRLRDAGGTYGGLVGKTKEDFGTGSATFVTFMEVMQGVRLRGRRLAPVRVRPTERQNRVLRGDVLFNGSSETPEEVALAAVVDYDPNPATYLNSFCFGYRLKTHDQIDPTYLAHFFRSHQGREAVSVLAQGATRYNIAKTKLLDVAPLLPSIDEQRAIVTVLSDVEAEIEGLNARLTKARAIKTGMMQELLTGRTRLPVEEGAA